MLIRAAWAEHVTVVRDEEPINKAFWGKYEGQRVVFEYHPAIMTNGDYYWLTVNSPGLLEIREELGLSCPCIPLHISIGHRA
jgi:hypothetical protein